VPDVNGRIVEKKGTKETIEVAMNIKNEKAHQMAQELAELTGETQTEAVTTAIQERLERIKKRKSKEGLSEKLLAIGRETAPLFPKGFKASDIDELLYDERGLPR
jgi:antitoxin VapB